MNVREWKRCCTAVESNEACIVVVLVVVVVAACLLLMNADAGCNISRGFGRKPSDGRSQQALPATQHKAIELNPSNNNPFHSLVHIHLHPGPRPVPLIRIPISSHHQGHETQNQEIMVIKVYISGISASKEVKKRQQRALFILDSLKVPYEAIDITEPGNQSENDRFRETCKKVGNEKIPLPPQFFNEDAYCGDWDDFFVASDEDTVLQFLQLQAPGEMLVKTPVPPPSDDEEDGEVFQKEKDSVNGHEENGHVTNGAAHEDEHVEEDAVVNMSPSLNPDDDEAGDSEALVPDKQDEDEVEVLTAKSTTVDPEEDEEEGNDGEDQRQDFESEE